MKSEWYLMIESGRKKEEYRAISSYWCCRLLKDRMNLTKLPKKFYEKNSDCLKGVPVEQRLYELLRWKRLNSLELIHVDSIVFHYGYTKKTMEWEVKNLHFGCGKPEWGAKTYEPYFVFELGKRIK